VAMRSATSNIGWAMVHLTHIYIYIYIHLFIYFFIGQLSAVSLIASKYFTRAVYTTIDYSTSSDVSRHVQTRLPRRSHLLVAINCHCCVIQYFNIEGNLCHVVSEKCCKMASLELVGASRVVDTRTDLETSRDDRT